VVVEEEQAIIEHNLAVTRRICEAWNLMDLDEYHMLFDAQVDYRNIPLPGDRHIGPDAVHAVLATFLETWDATLRIDNIAASGHVVLTERTENFTHRAGAKPGFELPVMGAFEFHDGKITAWRDYFELTQLRLR
jgi:limonene-1,2-epoxide hydrolase